MGDDETRTLIHPLSILFAGWLTGIFFGSFFTNFYWFIVPALLAFLCVVLPSKGPLLRSSGRTLLALFSIACALGMLRFSFSYDSIEKSAASLAFGKNKTFLGVVVRDPEERKFGTQFVADGMTKDTKEKVRLLVRVPDARVAYGDTFIAKGELKIPEAFMTSSGSLFDYPGYLKKDGIVGIFDAKEISIEKHNDGSSVISALYKFNTALIKTVRSLVGSEAGDLTNGVLLGDKSIMQQNREAFVSTGTVHIIALSGYNVSVVANFFTDFFSFLPRTFALGSGGLAIILFVLMTGAQSSALRAGMMALIVLYAKIKGREADVGRVILFAAALMTLWNPWLLVYDVSFQLSFLATIGIIYIAPKMERFFRWVPKKSLGIPLREIITTTLGTQLFVLPFLLYATGSLSFISPIANIIIVPLVPILMLFGAIVALVGIISPVIAIPFSFLAKGVATLMLGIIALFAKLPFAATTTHVSVALMLFLYALIFLWLDPFGWGKGRDKKIDV